MDCISRTTVVLERTKIDFVVTRERAMLVAAASAAEPFSRDKRLKAHVPPQT